MDQTDDVKNVSTGKTVEIDDLEQVAGFLHTCMHEFCEIIGLSGSSQDGDET